MNIACHIRNDGLYEQVQGTLARTGLKCDRFASDTALLRALKQRSFGAILVDIATGLQDQESIFTWLNCRSDDSTPVVVLSPVYSADLLAMTLGAGADEFVTKSIDPTELIARINALMRRCNRRNVQRVIELGGYVLDREASSITYRGEPIIVTAREFTIAWLFFSAPGVYVSRQTIGNAIWGVQGDIVGRTIEQHVYKLRKKLQTGPDRGVYIRTAYTKGYRLELNGDERAMDGIDAHQEYEESLPAEQAE
ncbi:MAG TPA: response regulator transcription factor [Noviherbaspirillum sp.]|nr:response regulator transcription factor [Noviherbaspirillum sp.]